MAVRIDYEFLFVGRDENSFLENYFYDFSSDHEDGGQVFVNLEIQNNLVDAEDIGVAIFETMEKVFFENLEKEPYERFESSLKAVNKLLAEFKSQKTSGYIGNLNVIISAVAGNQLFLTQCGEAEAYLIRKKYVSVVSEGLSDEKASDGDVFASIASGEVETGDFILLSSTRLVRYVTKTDLAQVVKRTGVLDSLNEIRDIISTEILGRVGLTGILFKESSVEEEKLEEEDDGFFGKGSGESHSGKNSGGIFNFLMRKRGVFLNFLKAMFLGILRWGKAFKRGLFSSGFGKDKILSLLILVIIVLFIGIMVSGSNQSKRQNLAKLDAVLVEVQNKIAEAETRGVYDKESASTILDQAYIDAKAVLESGYYRDKAGIFLLQIEEARDVLDNVKRISNPKVVADLFVNRSDVKALGFANLGDRVFVFDSNGLYEIVLDQVQNPLTISDDEIVVSATGFSDRNSILFLTRTGKLIEFREGIMSFVNTEDGAFRRGTALVAWGNRIYILDTVEGQIWRYAYKSLREIFGPAEGYIADETDISGAVDFAIDSNIYVLSGNGELIKFYAGRKQDFYINNPPFTIFNSPKVVYANDKLDQVYVLDSSGARVMVYKKDPQTGNIRYTSQYLFDDVGELRDIYVDPNSKRVYVLTPNKILEIE